MFVGWDWGGSAHDVAVMDDDGTVVDKWRATHTEEGIAAALRRLASHGDPATLPVAIEASRGLVVDRLLAAGHPVVPVDTRAFNAVRPRWGASRAKNDAGDAFKLADYLRTDRHTLRVLPPTMPQTLELQALSRLRSEHVRAKVSVINQMHALLGEHWPAARRLFNTLDSDIAMAFLDRFPTPSTSLRPPWTICTPSCTRSGTGRAPGRSCSHGCGSLRPRRAGSVRRSSPNWCAPRSGCCGLSSSRSVTSTS